jgi:hypothetical protein
VVAALFPPPARAALPRVFISEIHYDNNGPDAGEFVEIVGPVRTDLSGWSIVLYNGATGFAYDLVGLSGTILPPGAYGAVVAAIPMIQNGPDGIALVDAASQVVQFLSYGGTFMAANGPANGMTSTDIGVAESEATPPGFSLQMIGIGRTVDDFFWFPGGALPASPGEVNHNLTFLLAPFMKIRKVAGDSVNFPGGPAFVELQRGLAGLADLGGHRLKLYGPGPVLLNTFMLPATPLLNANSQRRILVSRDTFGGVAEDINWGDFAFYGHEPRALCFDDIDCVAWGDFGDTDDLPGPVGTPAPNFTEHQALERSILPGCPTFLDIWDDSADSATDFVISDRTRHNNQSPITEVDCDPIFADGFEG